MNTEEKSAPQSPENTPMPEVTPPVTPTPAPQVPPVPAAKKSPKTLIIVIVSIFGAVILLGLGTIGGAAINRYFSSNATPSLSSDADGNTTVTSQEGTIAAVAEKVGPSVVSIVTQTRSSASSSSASSEAAGTGIVVSKDGYVLTNNHVLESATSVSVVDSEGNLYEDVTIIGRDPLNDVAFLKIKSDKTFTAASIGSSSTIRTGQQVVAIGNALGQYSNTVTSGIISGTGRPVTASSGSTTESLTDLIQTDASINPGNSGGPLVNMAGQVIGINTAIVEDANGIGFAIPINATKGMLAGVLETGKVSRSYLGVNYLTITPDVAREYDLPVRTGAYIHVSGNGNPVVSGGPADKAGLKDGDIITKINSETLGTNGGLSSILGQYRPGDKVTMTILRDGKEQTISVELGAYSE